MYYVWIRTVAIWAAVGLFGLLVVASYAFDLTSTQITIGLAVLCGLVWATDRFVIGPTR